ncbi:MAG: hypothetical protein WDN49_09735 [Acetobacteraceae bacterium]
MAGTLDALWLAGDAPRAALNLGGIANITVVGPPRQPAARLRHRAGNCLMDLEAARITQGVQGGGCRGPHRPCRPGAPRPAGPAAGRSVLRAPGPQIDRPRMVRPRLPGAARRRPAPGGRCRPDGHAGRADRPSPSPRPAPGMA